MTEKLTCPKCGTSNSIIKDGVRYRADGTKVQRYRCLKRFLEPDTVFGHRFCYKGFSEHKKKNKENT